MCRLNLAQLFVSRVCPGLSEFELEKKMPLFSVFLWCELVFCLPFKEMGIQKPLSKHSVVY